ncbi:Galactinol--sucrose galactosyltransferase [Handroanthus impetiginosus]|uniref:Galactinol--sucrose galactosyltransferase n=1 Tax=Handroanthus impetiginosus TaxID=429701 RepID=A0A2G9HYA2_9LAMI|nr:Galactinol--sucrose galactosyltransferase [Handroanthus impetiginosus]
MTISATPTIPDSCLIVHGKVVLTNNYIQTSTFFLNILCWICFHFGGFRLISIFRFKVWWMIPSFGNSGSDVPVETQVLLLEGDDKTPLHDEINESSSRETLYILFLPALEGQFRTSLQRTSDKELQLCVEIGDQSIQTCQVQEALFVSSGYNPFELMRDSIGILAKHKGTFSHVEEKTIPPHLDWFGWCTWDASYTTVSPLKESDKDFRDSFSEGGCPPKFLIIDNGWQETVNDFLKEDIKENKKFMNSEDGSTNLREFIRTIRDTYGLKFSSWTKHAVLIVGYWGGLHPDHEAMKKYNPKIEYPVLSPGSQSHMKCGAMLSLLRNGVGLIDPECIYDFYNDLHSYLASCGAEVDIQNVVKSLGSGYGGRVTLTKKYQEALEESILKNFKDNNLICSMSQNIDSFYSSKKSSIARASEDYMPLVPTIQTSHVAAIALNSFFQGEIAAVDWDMFQSDHVTADFHAAARAIGGCAVYISDKPGKHDFKILKKLVLPDGSILREKYAGRPTRDYLFNDPTTDGKTQLKIWNMNKLNGVLGVFNCQEAGSWNTKIDVGDFKRDTSQDLPISAITAISGHISPVDIEFLGEVASDNWSGTSAIYAFNSGTLHALPKKGSLNVSLEVLKFEIFTICPIVMFGQNLQFYPIGLVDMYNSGGALESLKHKHDSSGCTIWIQASGCGRFGAYSSTKPRACLVDEKEEEFVYDHDNGILTFILGGECGLKEIEVIY